MSVRKGIDGDKDDPARTAAKEPRMSGRVKKALFVLGALVIAGIIIAIICIAVLPSSPAKDEDYPFLCAISKDPFSYNHDAFNGPLYWKNISENTRCCGGTHQSPIDLLRKDLTCRQLSNITYNTDIQGALPGTLKNNGQGATLSFSSEDLVTNNFPYTNGDDFALISMHFHEPSEHHINGTFRPAELHLVHYNRKYGTIQEAVHRHDGLAVIGIILEQDNVSTNAALNTLIDGIGQLGSPQSKVNVTIDPRELLLQSGGYYTYKGSLTNPPCSESVRWVVMKNAIHTTEANVLILKSLEVLDGGTLTKYGNERHVQPLNGRPVYTNTC
ncbi:alpha carbonic anhydrase 2-like isoform X2 [Haliotis rufescens]|uniref:alpha carbonic anhydrase 2-like isoform X2 n=1 Tax=Haliotis rufescens TaxID=6454 RepID=UPI001EAFECE3|nr:alpha carbonic anhydrase 2-like isoform X2 [Haliotis rufescens]